MADEPYAPLRVVEDLEDCAFYHTMEIPGYGLVEGQWDLRPTIREYCGAVDFGGKRVLEVGTASGFVCFYMEREGAEVVAFDLSDRESWDIVPFAGADHEYLLAHRREIMRKLNNGWWLTRRAVGSEAKVVYGSVYDVPAEIGPVDVTTFCAVLLHVRDPFQALFNGCRLARETVVVTEIVVGDPHGDANGVGDRPAMRFVPDHRVGNPHDTWWFLNPRIVQAWLGVLGFEDTTVTFHTQGGPVAGQQPFFTVGGRRTKGRALGD